jgi:hypothetical protein
VFSFFKNKKLKNESKRNLKHENQMGSLASKKLGLFYLEFLHNGETREM